VKVLQFPLRAGDTWSTTTSVSGRFNGIALGVQSETYVSQVDRVGDAKTPYATFESLRVRTVMDRTIVLFPSAGFDNPAQGLSAQRAQLGRVRLAWRF
jgi:hypothetical protein